MWNPQNKFLEAKYRPIYSPRTSYMQIRVSDEDLLADMTLNFDRFTINLLKKQFDVRNGQITLIQFISIVDQHLKVWQSQLPNRQVRLVRCLTILFKEIDINGNGLLDWQQFTNYIIEKATVLKNLKTKSQQVKTYSKANIKFKEKVQTSFVKSIYIEDINRVAMFEEGSNTIKFMNPETGEFISKNLSINMKQLVVNISSVKKQKDGNITIKKKDLVLATQTRLLDMIYLQDEKYKTIITSTSDGLIRGWKYNNGNWVLAGLPDNDEQMLEHHFNQQVYSLAWDSINQILYCGQHNGKVCMWNLKTDTQRNLQSNCQQQQHSLIITSIIPIPKLQFVATASLDSKIILWNTINYKVKSIYRQHTRGVLTMTFNQALILLFSAGFDHQICIWNPYISTLIHKIQTHNSPVVCLKITESNNQLISIDTQGIVKLSDTRKFNNVGGFSVVSQDQSQKFNPSSLCVIKKPLKIVIVGSGINIFEYDKFYNPTTADDVPSMCCKFIEQHLLFLTPSGNKVKVWNALNGDVNKIFLDICSSDITCFTLDSLKKRMVIGTVKGENHIYNVLNGAKFKQLPRHNGQVTHIITHKIQQMQLFFTAGVDGLIYIYKQMEDFFEVPRTINVKSNHTITQMVFSESTNLLIVGTDSGWVGFYNRDTAKLIGTYQDTQQISGIHLTNFHAILITNVRGKITFVLLPPLTQKFQEGFSFQHQQHDPYTLQTLNKNSQIAMCAYDKEQNVIFLIDDKSYIIAYKINIDEQSVKIKASQMNSFQRMKSIDFLWMTKAHYQIIRSIQYIGSQNLIVTTAYDKKVRIFSSLDGKYIDALQQNYEKFQPTPIAYEKISTGQIVSASLEPIFKKRPSIRSSVRYKINLTQSDPFLQFNQIQSALKEIRSNPNWKLFVAADKHYLAQTAQFNKIIEQVRQSNCLDVHLHEQKIQQFETTSLAVRKKQLDKIIKQRKSLVNRIAINFSNKSILNRIPIKQPQTKKPIQKKLKLRLNRQQQKIFDTFRKQSKRTFINKSTDRQNQRSLAQKLSRSKNCSTIKDDSIFKTQQQKNAVKRFNLAIESLNTTMRTQSSNVFKSMKTTRQRKLPKLI